MSQKLSSNLKLTKVSTNYLTKKFSVIVGNKIYLPNVIKMQEGNMRLKTRVQGYQTQNKTKRKLKNISHFKI